MAYATEDSGSLAKIGSASRLDSNCSPSRSLRSGRPTTTRFKVLITGPVNSRLPRSRSFLYAVLMGNRGILARS